MTRSLAMLLAAVCLWTLPVDHLYAQAGSGLPQPGSGLPQPGEGQAQPEDDLPQPGGGLPQPGGGEAQQAEPGEEAEPGERGPLELDARTEAEYDLYEDRMERAIQASGLNLQFNDAENIRVIASANVAQPFLQDIRRLEGIIAGNFPEPMKTSVDLRAANIAIFTHRSEWERWVRALFAEFEADGFMFEGMDIEDRMIESGSFHLEGIYSILLENTTPDQARRSVAFAVGYQYYNQLTFEQGPESLACGFGDLAEEALFQSPTVMVYSGYQDRQRAAAAGAWPNQVRQRFQQNLIPSLEAVFSYSTTTMQFPQYAESWSLTKLLVSNPEKFSQLLLAIREGDDPRQSVFEIYGYDENTLHQAWQQNAGR